MSSIEEQFHMMQQQIAVLQEQLNGASTPMQSADDTAPMPLHSMGTRPHYDWSPSDTLTELMNLATPLHTSNLLSDSERRLLLSLTLQWLILNIKPQLPFLLLNV